MDSELAASDAPSQDDVVFPMFVLNSAKYVAKWTNSSQHYNARKALQFEQYSKWTIQQFLRYRRLYNTHTSLSLGEQRWPHIITNVGTKDDEGSWVRCFFRKGPIFTHF